MASLSFANTGIVHLFSKSDLVTLKVFASMKTGDNSCSTMSCRFKFSTVMGCLSKVAVGRPESGTNMPTEDRSSLT